MASRKVRSSFLLFGIAYSLLLILSVLFIVPRHLSGNFGSFLAALLSDTEPEGQFAAPFFPSLIWILIPLTSIGLCLMSWVAYSAQARSSKLRCVSKVAGTVFFVTSLLPAFLVVRELFIYHIFDVAFSAADPSTDLILSLKSIVHNTNLLFGRRGVWSVPLIIFVETGLFFGFFLPGDSLLLTVGVLASAGRVDLVLLIPTTIMAAVLGDQLGYAIGRRSGEALAHQYKFVRDKMRLAGEFYSRHGGKTVVLARFVPVVRTFAPMIAGAGKMSYARFTSSNIAGATLWVLSVTLAGYVVGSQIPSLVDYVTPTILAVVLGSSLVWIFALIWMGARGRFPRSH